MVSIQHGHISRTLIKCYEIFLYLFDDENTSGILV